MELLIAHRQGFVEQLVESGPLVRLDLMTVTTLEPIRSSLYILNMVGLDLISDGVIDVKLSIGGPLPLTFIQEIEAGSLDLEGSCLFRDWRRWLRQAEPLGN